MLPFEQAFQSACDSGVLPGVVLMAADKTNSFAYSKAIGVRSSIPENASKPLGSDTVLALASCTKLMTAIAALQCVEHGLFDLDEDVGRLLPELGEGKEIISAFDDITGKATLTPKSKPISMRHLLSHSSGLGYDMMNPLLLKYRTQLRGEVPWSAPRIEERCNSPLLFEPGTSWMYGTGTNWAGKMVERATGQTLETYMAENIWAPIGACDITFWPEQREDLKDRKADISSWDESGKAVPLTGFDLINGSMDCLGGEGAFASAQDFMLVLQAVLRQDERLLKRESYEVLFTPQLSEASTEALNTLLKEIEWMNEELSMNIPLSQRKTWSVGGLLSLDEDEGWMRRNTLLWAGMPNLVWFVDRATGLCGLVAMQLWAERTPELKKLSARFQREIYDVYATWKAKGLSEGGEEGEGG